MTFFFRALIVSLMLTSVGTTLGQEYYVLAQPSLNLRDSGDRSEVLASIPFGAKVWMSQNHQESAQISGMDGRWVEVTYEDRSGDTETGVVFDAFLFPYDAPEFFGSRSDDLTFEDYTLMMSPAWHHGQTYPAGGDVHESISIHDGTEAMDANLIFTSTQGQALRFYRMWLVHLFGDQFDEFPSYNQAEFRGFMENRWNGVSELEFYPDHEWMRMSLSLKPYRDSNSNMQMYVISHHQHAH